MTITYPSVESETKHTGPTISVEQQLNDLASVGLSLKDGVSVDSLFDEFTSRNEIESEPYLRLVELLANWTHDGSYTPLCSRLWMDDTECIYDSDAYAQIVQRLQLLSSGKPQVTNITGNMNDNAETASVRFDVDDLTIGWEFSLDGDWLNTDVFTKYSDMLAEYTGERLYYVTSSEPGQEFTLTCLSESQAEIFGKFPNIRIAKIDG